MTGDQLLSVGVPIDWIDDVLAADEDRFLALGDHLPAEAAEALLEYISTGIPPVPQPLILAPEPFAHPDTLRRIRLIENSEELERALEFPWDKWTVFLHPSQRDIVERSFSGPARVAGSAGTGKSVVALHRAARFANAGLSSPPPRSPPISPPIDFTNRPSDRLTPEEIIELRQNKKDVSAYYKLRHEWERANPRVLLTSFSRPLAHLLQYKLDILCGRDSVAPLITCATVHKIAEEFYQLLHRRRPAIASEELIRSILKRTAAETALTEFPLRFLVSEWTHVVDAWQIESEEAYANVPRLGRKNRLGVKQRSRLWPVFASTRAALIEKGVCTWAQAMAGLAAHYTAKEEKPFAHIVVDEAQDVGVPELRFLAALAPKGPDALFFAGDLGQRIFQQPFSWLALGVDVRGRSQILKVNYRTSHQIREVADRLQPQVLRDVDGLEERRGGTVSSFNGPAPKIERHKDADAESNQVGNWIADAIAEGFAPAEIGVFVRDHTQIDRARAAVETAEQRSFVLSGEADNADGRIAIGTMHHAKGLEFKAVAVMACDDDVLPLQARVEAVADEVELDDVYETERQLLYVACTRARDRLLVSGVAPASEFLSDLELPAV